MTLCGTRSHDLQARLVHLMPEDHDESAELFLPTMLLEPRCLEVVACYGLRRGSERASEQFMIMAAAAMKEEKKPKIAGVCPSGEKQGEHEMESEPTS